LLDALSLEVLPPLPGWEATFLRREREKETAAREGLMIE